MGTVSINFLNTVEWNTSSLEAYELSANEVHVYKISIAENLRLLQQFQTSLIDAELQRGQKYLQAKDRQRFIISRGAQRHILAKYFGVAPTDLVFSLGDNQKPYLSDVDGRKLNYNLSHAGDTIVLAIANCVVGADVEIVDPSFRFRDILDDHFSKDEIAFIGQQDSIERFFLLWTRKEAILKATGQGLGEHLKETPSLDGIHDMPTSLLRSQANWKVASLLAGQYFISIANEIGVTHLRFFLPTF